MKILVVGCGKIGTAIISSLLHEGHEVVAIDNNPSVMSELNNLYDIMSVCGNGADCDTLSEAGVQNARLVVAVTDSDELNMLCCFLARRMGAHHTIARIRNPEYNDQSLSFMRTELHLSMPINPELDTAKEIYNILKLPAAVNIEKFSGRNFEIAELLLKEDSPLNGMYIYDVRRKFPGRYLICVVGREDNVFIPDGNFILKSGDRIGITAPVTQMPKLLKNLGLAKKSAKNIMILGASKTAYYLAKMLSSGNNNVKIIELNRNKCEEFCEALPSTMIVHGDGADQELLLEEGIRDMDAFVSLTGMDEENILISIFASLQKVPKVISKVNRDSLAIMAEKLGLETILSPRKIVSDILSSYARALENSEGSKVETLYKIMDDKAEALEFNVQSDFAYKEKTLKELNLKKNILVAGIIRGKKNIIPSGEDFILPGDKVIVIAAGHRLNDLSDIIK